MFIIVQDGTNIYRLGIVLGRIKSFGVYRVILSLQ